MHKLGYGLIFWCSVTSCFAQNNTTGNLFELKTGLSGQFFLAEVKDGTPFMSGPASATYTSVGLGVPLVLTLNLGSWGIEFTPTLRYPKTKKWLVQRSGIFLTDERNIIMDIHLSATKQFKHNNKFINSSWYGFGISFLNVNGNISGSYILTRSGWTQINFSNMRMIGPHLLFGHALTKNISIVAVIIHLDGNQVKNKPNILFYLLGNIGVRYSIYNNSK